MITSDNEIHALTETLISELVKAFGLPRIELSQRLIRILFAKAARATAKVGIDLDCIVRQGGLPAGARWLLPRFVKSHSACGLERIPACGPLLIASNHPASIDSILISAYVNRPDYKIIIGDIPFFEHLPHVSQSAIFAPAAGEAAGRMRVMRESIRHLRDGGSLLIFPRGGIEPDPAFMREPDGEFCHWSRSLQIFLQHVPGLQILIAMASGVISPVAMRHPITWFRRNRPNRQRLAFFYQIARQMLQSKEIFHLTPHITFGELIAADSHQHMLAQVEWAARRTLFQHMEWIKV